MRILRRVHDAHAEVLERSARTRVWLRTRRRSLDARAQRAGVHRVRRTEEASPAERLQFRSRLLRIFDADLRVPDVLRRPDRGVRSVHRGRHRRLPGVHSREGHPSSRSGVSRRVPPRRRGEGSHAQGRESDSTRARRHVVLHRRHRRQSRAKLPRRGQHHARDEAIRRARMLHLGPEVVHRLRRRRLDGRGRLRGRSEQPGG